MGFKPMEGIIVLREVIKDEVKTDSGIIIKQEKKEYGGVMAKVVTLNKSCELDIKKGDTVIVEKDKCQIVKIDDVECLICHEEDILCKAEKE